MQSFFRSSVPRGCKTAALVLIAAVFVFAGPASLPVRSAASDLPEPSSGLLDLRDSNWDFAQDGSISLYRWQFHPNRILTGAALQEAFEAGTDILVPIPGYWTGTPIPDGTMGRFGYGTLLYTIELPEPSNGLALQFGNMFSAYSVEVDGLVLGGAGTVGTSRAAERPAFHSRILRLPDGSTTLRIAMPLSNFVFWPGGGSQTRVLLGSTEHLANAAEVKERLAWFLGGVLMILGIYHLGLFVFRPGELSNLWFAMICFALLGRATTAWYSIAHDIAGEEYYWLSMKLAGLASYSTLLFIVLYVHSLFREDFSNYVLYFVMCFALPGIISVFLPGQIWTALIMPMLFAAGVGIVYTTYVSVLVVVRRRSGSTLFLLAWLGFGAAALSSVLNMAQVVAAQNILPAGFLFFVALQGLLLSQRLSRSFDQVEALSEELAEKNESLRRLDELKDQFLANTSHELRTPLNGVIGLAESLRAGAQGSVNAGVDRTLSMISASGRRLASLVNDILDSAKLRNRDITLRRGPVDLREIVGIVLYLCEPLIGAKQVTLEEQVPKDLPLVDADENRLQQILQNLVGNAIKFTAEGQVSVRALEDGDQIAVCVEDTGIGIPAVKQGEIFTAFEQVDATTEREFGGTGLGLSITKNLVELHGGSIWVDSRPGAGSRFWFTLPKADPHLVSKAKEKAEAVEPAPASAKSDAIAIGSAVTAFEPVQSAEPGKDAPNGISVLVVDDDEINRHVVSNFLGLEHYRVFEAEDGAQALDLVDRYRPDLVLLDIMMPKLNGFEVCRQIREKATLSDTPIIFLSAKNRTEDLVAGFESGGNDYVTKPVSGPELLARVGTHARLTRIQAEAVRQEKLAAIGQMAAGIVHDFKNSIGVIKGYAEMLAEDEIEDRDEAVEFASTIASEADRISSMAYEILEYSRGQISLKRETVSVGSFLEDVEAAISPMFDQRGLDATIADPPHAQVSIDIGRMVRAFTNIAGNAADALSAGGRFDLSARQDGGRIAFALSDTGPGIPDAIRESLFDPFVTHGKANGTGLGMALVKSTIEAHGGTIRFETASGQGTTFLITLDTA